MEIKLQTNRLILFIIVNTILLVLLYNVPVVGNESLEKLCVYKSFLGKECWNCGMTRACLSLIQGEYSLAMMYNWRVLIVFPLILFIYIQSWYKFIIKNNN